MGLAYINGVVSSFDLNAGWIKVRGDSGLTYKLRFDDKLKLDKYIKNTKTSQVITVKQKNVFIVNKKGKEVKVK